MDSSLGKLKPVNIKLHEFYLKKLDNLSDVEGSTRSQLIREILYKFIKDNSTSEEKVDYSKRRFDI